MDNTVLKGRIVQEGMAAGCPVSSERHIEMTQKLVHELLVTWPELSHLNQIFTGSIC